MTDLFDSMVTVAPSVKKRTEYLERVITALSKLHGEGKPTIHPDSGDIVADIEFDDMCAELARINPNSKALLSGSFADFDPLAKVVKHDPPMVSIKKANGKQIDKEGQLSKWIEDLAKRLNLDKNKPETWLVQSYKRDGAACSLYYENGKLVKAGLRPRDGVNGEDVTENIKYVIGVPKELPLPLTCSIRGELECPISIFQQINGSDAVDNQEFANPRNYTTGSIRQFKDPSKTKPRKIHFTGHSIEAFNDASKYYKTEKERAIFCNKILKVPFVRCEEFNVSDLKRLEEMVTELDYEVDGIVLSVNDLELQDQAGRHGDTDTGELRGKLAWKFADDVSEPRVKAIEWQVGRTGKITPVLTFNPVKLAGTMVERAGGYSLGFILRNEVNVGKKVRIRKSGKIIPESLGFYSGDKFIDKDDMEAGKPGLPANFDFNVIQYPKTCPSCGEKTGIDKGQKHGMFELICENKLCPAQNVRHFVNYLQKFGVKGIGEDVIGQLVESGVIKNLSDLYTLKVTDIQHIIKSVRISLLTVARIHMVDAPEAIVDNPVLARKTIDAINRKKKITMSKLISCLGIDGVGNTAGASISSHFREVSKFINATEDDLKQIDGIGEKASKAIVEYLKTNKNEIATLIDKYLEIEVPKSGKFTNKVFVFTGAPLTGMGKDYYKELVEAEGGIVKGSVSKSANYVIIGTDAGQKADIARDLKDKGHPITIIDSRKGLEDLFDGIG